MASDSNHLSSSDVQFLPDRLVLIRTGLSIPYSSIESAQIYRARNISLLSYLIIYWVTWLLLTYGFMFSTGSFEWRYIRFVLSDLKVAGVIIGLGFMAIRPVYSMIPLKTFLKVKAGKTWKTTLEPFVESGKIDDVLRLLRKRIDSSRIINTVDQR